jgi:hypothetical protein
LQYGVAVPQAGFLPLPSSEEGAQAWHAPATQAGFALSVQAGFTPATFCDSRHTTHPCVVLLHTGASLVQSALLEQPLQVPPTQKGLVGSLVQSPLPWHCPHHEPPVPAKQCCPLGQLESFAHPCRHAPVGVQMRLAGHSLSEAQAWQVPSSALQCGLAGVVQSALLRHWPAESGAQHPPWHDVPCAHDELLEQLACVDGHWFAPTHSLALHSRPAEQLLELLQGAFFAGPPQAARITTEHSAAKDTYRAATAAIGRPPAGKRAPLLPSEPTPSQPTEG